ncbi:unnamed protein product [Peronospora belbahrii]|uniref:Uncharacterized protein n=1 Tax=Peronospora belbahrii TaxID=622444 RepID=A0ABN8DBG4_9STRA|nr:unnamed protein product [Peronospora belbahrii]
MKLVLPALQRAKPPAPRQVSTSLAATCQLPPRPEAKAAEPALLPLPSSLSSRPMSLSKGPSHFYAASTSCSDREPSQLQAQQPKQQLRRQQPETASGAQADGKRQPRAPSTPVGPPLRMAPTASTSFVSVSAAEIPPSTDAVAPVNNKRHAYEPQRL